MSDHALTHHHLVVQPTGQKETISIHLAIPAGVRFSSLNLVYRPSEQILQWDIQTLRAVWDASVADSAYEHNRDGDCAALIVLWYLAAVRAGEPTDAVAETLVSTARQTPALIQMARTDQPRHPHTLSHEELVALCAGVLQHTGLGKTQQGRRASVSAVAPEHSRPPGMRLH